jgi:hypothetical protein
MQGKGVAFLGMGLGTTEVTSLRSITPLAIKKEHDRARAHTPSKIIPGLRKVSRGSVSGLTKGTREGVLFWALSFVCVSWRVWHDHGMDRSSS